MPKFASQFVALPPERRALAFAQTAARMSASSVMVEKDFWVCWLLGLLFAEPELAPHLVFKGGRSLSKVYGVIDRFSEDIDLSMSPAFVGADEAAFEAMKSRTRRDAALALMQAQCGERTRSYLMPRLEQAIVDHLGRRKGGPSWLRYEDDPIARSLVVHFEYPTAEAMGFEYLRREVKLEVGSLTDQQPTGQHAVRAWVIDDFPGAFADWSARLQRSSCRARSGRRQPSCMPSTIDLRTNSLPIATRGTTPTWDDCSSTPALRRCCRTMRSVRALSIGRAACSHASGHATTWRSRARSACCLRTIGLQRWRATTRRCARCFSLRHPTSMRSWLNSPPAERTLNGSATL